MEFYDNYETALQTGEFTRGRIYNLDKTGVTTVVQAPKVVAQLGACKWDRQSELNEEL